LQEDRKAKFSSLHVTEINDVYKYMYFIGQAEPGMTSGMPRNLLSAAYDWVLLGMRLPYVFLSSLLSLLAYTIIINTFLIVSIDLSK